MKSIPVAVKVGGAGVLGGGGIAGTGLLIHNQLKFRFEGFDKELVDDAQATIGFETNESTFTVDTSKKTATITAKTDSKQTGNKFKKDSTTRKWTCDIKVVFEEVDGDSNNLNQDTTFDKAKNKQKFMTKFEEKDGESQKHKAGFVKSCAINRAENPKNTTDNWTSEIVIKLKPEVGGGNTKKYVLSDEAINSIFMGTWNNKTKK